VILCAFVAGFHAAICGVIGAFAFVVTFVIALGVIALGVIALGVAAIDIIAFDVASDDCICVSRARARRANGVVSIIGCRFRTGFSDITALFRTPTARAAIAPALALA